MKGSGTGQRPGRCASRITCNNHKHWKRDVPLRAHIYTKSYQASPQHHFRIYELGSGASNWPGNRANHRNTIHTRICVTEAYEEESHRVIAIKLHATSKTGNLLFDAKGRFLQLAEMNSCHLITHPGYQELKRKHYIIVIWRHLWHLRCSPLSGVAHGMSVPIWRCYRLWNGNCVEIRWVCKRNTVIYGSFT